ncbi:ATP-binding protein [Raoultibacter phocaeensis]|uniref:ATP-binding protein n=1 Tax=Raoultibacter phocaeensis TaxID=2479841 RepID=UPI001117B753|nr:ATP-binding protein [Raoultibacter phocaeensis]
MLLRQTYLEKLLAAKGGGVVKVLTGVRRCGKSYLLKLLKNVLVAQGYDQDKFIEIDFERLEFSELRNPQEFYRYVKGQCAKRQIQFVFVDEVQELDEWAKTINGIRAEFNLDIYVTGSNSRMFVGEHLTYLSGRYIKIDVYPLSFSEYLQFKNFEIGSGVDYEQTYDRYVQEGGFPAVVLAEDPFLKESLIDGLFDSIFMRDIILRGNIKDEMAFSRVARFALDNIGNETSAYSIAKTFKAQNHSIKSDTVDNYLGLMVKAYLLYQCNRYDIRGKEHLSTNGKYYVVDPGLRNRVLGQSGTNRGHMTENMVYLELLRKGYAVSVGVFSRIDTEIDFVATKKGERFYIQVSESVLDEAVLEREIAPFSYIRDGYPRILITKDTADYSHGSVKHINLYKFLLGESELLT